MILNKIEEVFKKYPGTKFGFSKIDFSEYSDSYKCSLVFAVPYSQKISLSNYNEELFEKSICDAREIINDVIFELKDIFTLEKVKYFIPPVAQNDEISLLAPFSFKFAAVNAGLGWIGKNDVLITKENGPRQRLSAILLDYDLPCGKPIEKSLCLENCTSCVDACLHNALKNTTWNIKLKRSELIDYKLCNQKRSLFIKKIGRKSSCGLCLAACPIGL